MMKKSGVPKWLDVHEMHLVSGNKHNCVDGDEARPIIMDMC